MQPVDGVPVLGVFIVTGAGELVLSPQAHVHCGNFVSLVLFQVIDIVHGRENIGIPEGHAGDRLITTVIRIGIATGNLQGNDPSIPGNAVKTGIVARHDTGDMRAMGTAIHVTGSRRPCPILLLLSVGTHALPQVTGKTGFHGDAAFQERMRSIDATVDHRHVLAGAGEARVPGGGSTHERHALPQAWTPAPVLLHGNHLLIVLHDGQPRGLHRVGEKGKRGKTPDIADTPPQLFQEGILGGAQPVLVGGPSRLESALVIDAHNDRDAAAIGDGPVFQAGKCRCAAAGRGTLRQARNGKETQPRDQQAVEQEADFLHITFPGGVYTMLEA